MPRNVTTRPEAIWLAPRGEDHERVHEREQRTRGRTGERTEPDTAGLDAHDVGGERAGEDRTLGAEVDHPGALA